MQLKSSLKTEILNTLRTLRRKYKQIFFGECAVLLYHRVVDIKSDPQLLAVSVENFEKQISLLKRNHNVLKIDEFFHHISERKKIPLNSVAITFDDGYYDNFEFALPILERNNIEALFYITTGNINTQKEFWWDEMERAFLPGNGEGDRKTYEELLPELRKLSPAIRDKKILEYLKMNDALLPRSSHRSMTSDELKKMALSKSAVIGAHTVNHPSLANLSYKEQMDEIKNSKDFLEELLKKNISHFSYPFGTRNDFNNETKIICRDLGFQMVMANYPDMANSQSDLFSIPRFLVRNWNEKEFTGFLNTIFKR